MPDDDRDLIRLLRESLWEDLDVLHYRGPIPAVGSDRRRRLTIGATAAATMATVAVLAVLPVLVGGPRDGEPQGDETWSALAGGRVLATDRDMLDGVVADPADPRHLHGPAASSVAPPYPLAVTYLSALPNGIVRYRALDGYGRADVRGWIGSPDEAVARVVLEYGDGPVLSVATRSFESDVELATFLLRRPSP